MSHTVILSLTDQKGSLYYFEGNFYHPIDLVGRSIGQVKRGIRDFWKANKEKIKADRALPTYKTLVQIFDEQYPEG